MTCMLSIQLKKIIYCHVTYKLDDFYFAGWHDIYHTSIESSFNFTYNIIHKINTIEKSSTINNSILVLLFLKFTN